MPSAYMHESKCREAGGIPAAGCRRLLVEADYRGPSTCENQHQRMGVPSHQPVRWSPLRNMPDYDRVAGRP